MGTGMTVAPTTCLMRFGEVSWETAGKGRLQKEEKVGCHPCPTPTPALGPWNPGCVPLGHLAPTSLPAISAWFLHSCLIPAGPCGQSRRGLHRLSALLTLSWWLPSSQPALLQGRLVWSFRNCSPAAGFSLDQVSYPS